MRADIIKTANMFARRTLVACILALIVFTVVQLFTFSYLERSISCVCDKETDKQPATETLVTLFTSAKTLDQSRLQIHRNTLVNWASLRPRVQPVLYVLPEDEGLAAEARRAGWLVRPVTHLLHGVPVIRSLFLQLTSAPDSPPRTPFYGYANADILFDQGLVDTLEGLVHLNFSSTPGVLMTGRRINVKSPYIDSLDSARQENIGKLQKHGRPADPNAQDYFITTTSGFPWDVIPDFVLGRPGYDNWLVSQSLQWKMTVVDLTRSVLAVHQSGGDGDRAGWSSEDLCINRNLAGPFDYMAGQTVCATWYTTGDFAGRLALVQRPWLPSSCKPRVVTSLSREMAFKLAGNQELTATRKPRKHPNDKDNPCVF